MIRRIAMAGTFAALCSAAVIAQTPATGGSAQTPPGRPTTAAPADQDRPAASSQGPSIVLTGCLKREEQVPGREPNIVERQGVMEDYIITNAAPASTASGAVGTSGAAGATSPSASAGRSVSSQYKVEGIPDERLSALVGKRVEITGHVDADDAREAPTGTSGAAGGGRAAAPAPGADMPEFEAVSIREVAGSCDEAR
jgi:hypothetical protein